MFETNNMNAKLNITSDFSKIKNYYGEFHKAYIYCI